MEFNNNVIKRKNPINRNNFFFDEETYQFELEMVMDYVEQDINQTIILYEVDLTRTNRDALYNEALKGEINFKTPKEINVLYLLEESERHTYEKTKSLGAFIKLGKFGFDVFEKTLEKEECDIKRGDYVGLQVTPEKIVYFEVTDDGKMNYDNQHSYKGYKPYYRTIDCAMVDVNQFNG